MTNWTNHDRVAFNEWLNTDLGQKFFAHFKENRPSIAVGLDGLDLNRMAMQGAIYAGYEQAIAQIDKMRHVSSPNAVEARYVADTHKDNP